MATANLPQGPDIIGAAVPRIDGALKTTGSAKYAVDHQFPHLAHAFAVQSRIGKGRIRSLDASAAEKMPGVLLVLHHGNMEGVYRTFPHQEDGTISESRPPFEDDKIYYWGQYVAVVVAETLEQAKAAAQAVNVEYDAETPDVRTDLGAGFTGKRESSWKRGDPDKALSEAPVTIDQTYVTPVETHNPMEMHGTVAVWDGDNVTLYECTQGVVNHRTVMSEVLGVPRENVRVISRFIGSGFGGKLFPWPQSTLAAVAATKLNRPVKISTRSPHDVFQHRPSAAHAAAHSPGRDAGRKAHRDPPRLLHRDFALDDFVEHCGEQTPFLYSCPNLEVTTAHGAAQCGRAGAHARPRRSAGAVCAGVGHRRIGRKAEDGPGGVAPQE